MRPNPVDVHVGQRLRQRRVLAGLSQEKLARMVGITFQQVQKYERGANRIVASRLYQLANVLDVPVSYFFEDMSEQAANDDIQQQESLVGADALSHDIMAERETLELVRTYYSIENEQVRRRAFDLLRALSNRNAPSLDDIEGGGIKASAS
jgi:transcriptional regulator with XRE-family HTH domain